MAYCRFSSDNFNCDVHCSAEECEDGSTVWVTHLAAHRRIGGRKEPLDLPHAGESYEDASAAACLARLRELRRMGYRFPDRALQRLEEDAAGAPRKCRPRLTSQQGSAASSSSATSIRSRD